MANRTRPNQILFFVSDDEKRIIKAKMAQLGTKNMGAYVDTFEPEPEIDLNEVAAEIRKLQSEIKDIDAELKPFFDELGLDFPFDVEGK